MWGGALPIWKSYKIKKNLTNVKLTAAYQYWGAPQCNGVAPVYFQGEYVRGVVTRDILATRERGGLQITSTSLNGLQQVDGVHTSMTGAKLGFDWPAFALTFK